MIPDLDRVARKMLSARDEGRQLAPQSAPAAHLELEDAYRLAARICALRAERGERAIGRKIGFTNRTIWPQYKVYAPIWGYIYDISVFDLAGGSTSSKVGWAFEPRIEPKIVFRLAEAPVPGMNERDLLGCVEWVAHGFEIVESIFPGWIFTAPGTVAGFGLHRALFTGPKHSVRSDPEGWLAALSSFEIELMYNGAVADRGHARNVLGGPLSTLIHLMEILQSDSANPRAFGRRSHHDGHAYRRNANLTRRCLEHGANRHRTRRCFNPFRLRGGKRHLRSRLIILLICRIERRISLLN